MINRDARLVPYIKKTITDAGITVDVDPKLQPTEYVAIKVDDYYAGLKIATPPKAVDYVVVVDCQCNWYAMYILELKNVNGPDRLDLNDIKEKFENTINGFLSDTFSEIFMNDRFKYKGVKLYLVSDAYGQVGKFKNHAEYLRFRERINRRDTLKVDRNLTQKVFRFRNKIMMIEYDMPPNPIIQRW